MNVEPVIESEVSKKDKDRYCILMHIYRIYTHTHTHTYIYMYWWSYLQGSKGDTDILDTVARGEGGMIWKNSTEMYTLSYVK